MAPDPSTAIDYYALLDISPASTESEIRRAYRKTSLLYHPDKVEPTPANLDKFQLLQTALSILTDPEERPKYDQTREAKLRRQAETAALDSRRRQMVEDLERREEEGRLNGGTNGLKRKWTEQELDVKRIQAENRKRIEEAMRKKRAEALAAREQARKKAEAETTKQSEAEPVPEPEVEVPQDRNDTQRDGKTNSRDKDEVQEDGPLASTTVKVRWKKDDAGLAMDREALRSHFDANEVETVVLLKDKRQKIGGQKIAFGRAFVVFKTDSAARKAIKRGPWDGVESLEWMDTPA
jgi:DnaJ homolog subfamily C member 17